MKFQHQAVCIYFIAFPSHLLRLSWPPGARPQVYLNNQWERERDNYTRDPTLPVEHGLLQRLPSEEVGGHLLYCMHVVWVGGFRS